MSVIKKKGMSVLLVFLTGMLLSANCCLAETDAGDSGSGTVKQTAAAAVLLNEESERTGQKTIYDFEDYPTYDVVIQYKNGTVTTAHRSSGYSMKKMLSRLEKDPSVASYQPDFQYNTEEAVETESSSEGTGNIYYGAPGEQDSLISDIEARTDLSIADPHTISPNDRYYYLQWGLFNDGSFEGLSISAAAQSGIDIRAEEAWDVYRAKKETVIALVDTGVDYTNPDLTDHLWVNEDEIEGNGIDDDGNGYIDDVRGWNFYSNNNRTYNPREDDHATHCASSMIAASNEEGITGIADYSNIKVMNVKALGGSDGTGSTLSVMKAIQYAEQNGASICNLSLGTDVNDHLLYKTMKESGMLFIIAAGNSSTEEEQGKDIDASPCYPASYTLDNILSVANLAEDGTLHYTSNYGASSVDLAAPGTDILGYFAGSRLGFMTGTSMAAPYVSAAAAMVYTASESRTLADTAAILKKTAQPLSSLSGVTASGGMLDLAAALNWK